MGPDPAFPVSSKSHGKLQQCNFPCPSSSLMSALSAKMVPGPLNRLEAISAIRELAYIAFLDRFSGQLVNRSSPSYEKLLNKHFEIGSNSSKVWMRPGRR